jgi:hypothetical protein
MVTFYCDGCGALVFFESVTCVSCGRALGFLPDVMAMTALEPAGDAWKSLADGSQGKLYRPCANGVDYGVCNWYVPVEETEGLCAACRLNEMIPDTSVPDNRERWHRAEIAKRRLVYTLRRLDLPTEGDGDAAGARPPLRVRFLADVPGEAPVMTGHANGVITLNLAEADDAERERRRVQLFEPQRTLVGHFRHESGHYYWSVLIADSPWHERVRALFGDERADYAAALSAYYANGPSATWPDECVTAYASAHPWEDWAETWAHLLHMTDSLETAASFGLSVRHRHPSARTMSAEPGKAVAAGATFDTVLDNWFPLTNALNSLNRGLGLPDLYPYVLSPKAIEKLRLVHEVITAARGVPAVVRV